MDLDSENPECPDTVGYRAPSSICVLLPQDFLMTGVFRDLLTKHFYSSDTIDEYSLKSLIWRDGEDTDILIESNTRWRPGNAQTRPAIIIRRNDCEYMPAGIGDIRQAPEADQYGDEHYVRYWVGSHTFFCIAKEGAHAEILAAEVKHELSHFGPKLAKSIGLKRFRVLRVGAVGELEESSEHYVVPITVGYGYEDRVILRLNAPKLHAVSLSMILEA